MTDYNTFKVTELKELLKERGIPSTGLSRKAQIIQALEAHDATAADAAQAERDDGVAQDVDDGAQDEQDVPAELPAEEAHATAEGEGKPEPPSPAADVPTEDGPEPESQPTPSLTQLEKNEPISKEPSALNTPQRASPAAESVSSDTRKRKRRSPTPPISQETVIKKLKSAEEELVKLPEDEVVGDAPAPVMDVQDSTDVQDSMAVESETKTILPSSVSDDVMDVTGSLPAEDAGDAQHRSGSPMDTTAPEEEEQVRRRASPSSMLEETSGPPSMHPSTRALYIRDLVRPLQPQQLRDHLISIAASPPSSDIIKTFHLDTLRTHAFIVFSTFAAASTARSALHGRIWPDEPSRKALWVDFIPEAHVADWIDAESSSGGRRDAKKWEIVYDTDDEGRVIATHAEAPGIPRHPSFSTAAPTLPSAQNQGQGQGMPNAPLGPRADRPATNPHRPPIQSPDTQIQTQTQPKPAPAPSNGTFTILDERFNHTTTKPKLYWLPVDQDLADKRLDELEVRTSRDWQGGRAMRGAGASAVDAQLRRYTFEDGGRVVDNGADIPSFRSEGGRAPGVGGRGGRERGGGGFRGRR